MTKIENDFLGLSGVNGECTVSANIWTGHSLTKVVMTSNSNKVKRAFNSKKRYSLDTTMKLVRSGLKKNQTEALRALMYRAKVTDKKATPIGCTGCVTIGVLNKA